MTCECYQVAPDPQASHPPSVSRIFRPSERWDVAELRKRLGVVTGDIPSVRTLHTPGRDAVLTGFFSASTLWPELQVTPHMRERAAAALAGNSKRRTWRKSPSAKCRPARCAAS